MRNDHDTTPEGNARFGQAQAMSSLTGSERQARQSLRPPRQQRGLALALTVAGLVSVSAWLQQHARFWDQLHLGKAGGLIVVPLSIYAVVLMGQGQADASWGVASSRRGGTWSTMACVISMMVVAGIAMSSTVSVALRWCAVAVAIVVLTVMVEAGRRRRGGNPFWSLVNSILICGWVILVVFRFDIWQLLGGGALMAYGGYQLVIARRDQRRQGQQSPNSAVM